MKKQSNLFGAINKFQVEGLTHIIQETLATGFSKNKIFTAADLWNIQRQNKSRTPRRFSY